MLATFEEDRIAPLARLRSKFPLGGVISILSFLLILSYFTYFVSDMDKSWIPELRRTTVHIKHRDHVRTLIEEFIKGGETGLQVVADFDRTISKHRDNGQLVETCYSVFDNSPLIPEAYKAKATALYNKYYPIEVDHNLSTQEKVPHMIEWWNQAHDMIKTSGITQETLATMVRESNIKLRDGVSGFFSSLHDHQVPLLIFSAGVGDIIDGVLRQRGELFNNMKIVSNFLDFDDVGHVVGFKGKLIHIYNKNEAAIHDSDYFKDLSSHQNVLLLGDSLGDLTMATGVEGGNILKIGFLNEEVEGRLETYMNAFDVVLTEDNTMDIPNALLRVIFQ